MDRFMDFNQTKQRDIIGWISAPPFLYHQFSNPMMLSHTKFMLVAFTKWPNGGIYSFDTDKFAWIKSHLPYNLEVHSSAIDRKTHTLYVYDCRQNFMEIDIKHRKMQTIYNKDHKLDVGEHVRCFFAEKKFHLIGGTKSKYHYVWNKNDKQFHVLHEFTQQKYGLVCPEIIYVESKELFYLFGGQDGDRTFNPIDIIYCYSSWNNIWTQLDIKMPLPLTGFGFLSTRDGKYILLFGGYTTGYKMTDNIYIYDLENNIFIMSQVKLPVAGIFKAAITDNFDKTLSLTYGYIRDLHLLPIDIIDSIHKMCITETVHLIQYTSGKHWITQMQYILH
eukprot:445628_1